ncbi:MAG: hypothetical protein QF773_07745 [Lentisphaeria bacterium]|nr:hypothetical protein [Lentisphaeria bacterium]
MSDLLHVGIVAFDITPSIHPEYGAWGTTPIMTEIDLPLSGRCLALRQDDRELFWFALDLCGNNVEEVTAFRAEIADALDVSLEQVMWSTSQTHSSPTVPGSNMPGGSSVTARGEYDKAYCDQQRRTFFSRCITAAQAARDGMQPATVRAGRGFCDTISYNRRFPMPNGGVKFSRSHGEALQSNKFFDTTIGLVVFDDAAGKPLAALFNFGAHPATMINDKYISPDWVGSARSEIEAALDGVPAMFVQGFCGDVNCYHIFGTPAQAKATGMQLGQAAVQALPTLIPARSTPFSFTGETIAVECRPMWTRAEVETALEKRCAFIDGLDADPGATWFDGINFPEQMLPEHRKIGVKVQTDYLHEAMRRIDAGEPGPEQLPFLIGAVRIGDVAAVLAHGENFSATGRKIRQRSPFVHTLICGDTNGLFGYLGDDAEIDRGGYGTYSFWLMFYSASFRLPPAKGSADRVIDTSVRLLQKLLYG